MRRAVRVVTALAAVLVTITAASACATGTGAVAQGGTFRFVSPGGQQELFYDPPADRGRIEGVSGDSLLDEGETLALADHDGRVVVLNVWGSWCGPCRTEADDLQLVHERLQEAGDGTVLGIDVRDNRDAAADFKRDRGITYPSIYDPPARSLLPLAGFPRTTVPATIVLDREHRVAAVYLREILAEELWPVVERVAAEPSDG